MKLIYGTLPGKEVVYVLPITSILGRLPVVLAGDTLIRATSSSDIAMDAATEPNAMTIS